MNFHRIHTNSTQKIFAFAALFASFALTGLSQATHDWPEPHEDNYIAKDFHFKDG